MGYLSVSRDDEEIEDDRSPANQLFSAMLASVILFVYIMGEIRQSFLTVWHYWSIIEYDLLHYGILFMLCADIALELTIAFIAIITIERQTEMGEQLAKSLEFFFILSLDEWIWTAVIEDFDVLEEEDFNVESRDLVTDKGKGEEHFLNKKAKIGVYVGCSMVFYCVVVIAYFYIQRAGDDDY